MHEPRGHHEMSMNPLLQAPEIVTHMEEGLEWGSPEARRGE
jgi:hypothetical protein